MKGKLCTLIAAISIASSLPAVAEEADQGFYLGAKAGRMSFDVNAVDDTSAKGLYLGYNWNEFGVELERNTADADWDLGFVGGKLDVDTTAVYGTYRSTGPVYFKAKIGFLDEEIEDEDGESESDSGASYGLGVGARAGDFRIEAEYTLIEQDVNLLSLGAHYQF